MDTAPMILSGSQMTLAGPPLLLWQIPELEDTSAPVAITILAAAESTEEILPPPDDHAPAAVNEPSMTEIEQDQRATGYAEGWERGLSEGRERGYAEGIAAGTEAARAALSEQAQRLAAIINKLGAPISALEAPVEEAVAALALEVARCVIGSETSRSHAYLVPLVREALAKVPIEMGTPKIVLNPADRELIGGLAPDLEPTNAVLIGDDAIEPGDCLVVADGQGAPIKDMRWRPRTGDGMSLVDLSLAERWRAVMRRLFEGEDR
jgi:flagellar assembly protein FliH